MRLQEALEALPEHLRERVARVHEAGPLEGELVVYWMHGTLRAHENPALDVARTLAAQCGRPLLVYQALSERHPFASDRHWVFALEGAMELARECAALGLRHAFHLERSGHRGPVLRDLARLAACVVTDEVPVEPLRSWTRSLARTATLVTVDAACVVPMPLVERAPARAFGFRRATARLREERLACPWPSEVPHAPAYEGELPFEPLELDGLEPQLLVSECDIDHSIAPVPGTRGGARAGYARWASFRDERLARYARDRNDPCKPAVSRLSPYLHWGMVSPLCIAREAAAIASPGAEKFLDELLIWREVAWAFCYHTEAPDTLEALPEWARETLADHRGDPREASLSWEELARARTGDPLWDAAQRSLLVQGELHNNVRMSWGKAFLRWTATPELALERALDLNHRYALDGRDPSSYGGILWCFGLFDRPFTPERAVEGTLRGRSTRDHARRLDVESFATRTGSPRGGALEVGVIGSGLAGLAAARTLCDHGHRAVVFDKGRGPGGRISTRRAEPFAFDHGAQYFTARDPHFRRLVSAWQEQGVVAPWKGRIVTLEEGQVRPSGGGTERFVGTPGMSALAKHLARDLEVHQGVRIEHIERTSSGWALRDTEGRAHGEFDRLVVTAPPAQARALLGPSSALTERLADVPLRPCWAILFGFAEPLDVGFDGAFCEGSAFSWIARNSSKPGRPEAEAWVLHGSPSWTEENLERSREELIAVARDELERIAGVTLPEVRHADAHRWMYALPAPGLDEGYLQDRAAGLVLAGDGYCGGRVEGAYLSGVAGAAALLAAQAAWP